MSQKIVLSDVAFTDTSLPVIYPDALMAKGSLFLFDPAHSQGGFAGVPAAGATVPNVAWETAKALIGSGTAASLAGIVQTTVVAGQTIVERTPKGAVHVISSQSAQTLSGQGWNVNLAAEIRAWLEATFADNGVAHPLYASVWYDNTRQPLVATANQSVFHWLMNTSNLGFSFQNGAANPAVGKNGGTYNSAGTDTTVPAGTKKHLALSATGWQGAAPASWSTKYFQFGAGGFGPYSGFMLNKAGSHVIRRAYLEYLPASGRTFAEVLALDQALYTKEVLTAGGKYFGDTIVTDPSALP